MAKKNSLKDLFNSFAPLVKNFKKEVEDKKENQKYDEAIEILESINDKLRKQTTYKDIIKMGLVRGAATAIGATVIAALFLTILSNVVDTVDDVPILRDIIEQTEDSPS